jgi:hypothetical protein
MTMTFDLGYVWRGDGAQGTYELFIPTQPSSVGVWDRHDPCPKWHDDRVDESRHERRGSSATWRGSMSEPPHVSHAARAGRARTSLVGPQERVLGA